MLWFNFQFIHADIFKVIDPVSYNDMDGYASSISHYKKYFKELLKKNHCKVVIEIGSFLGKSSIEIAKMLSDDGMIIAVDTWDITDPTNPVQNSRCIRKYKEMEKNGKPELYTQFLSNCKKSGMYHKITPLRMKSEVAAKIIDKKVTKSAPVLLYIDGDHSEEGVSKDLNAWFPVIHPDSVICGDDWHYRHMKEKGITWDDSVKIDMNPNDYSKVVKQDITISDGDTAYTVRRAVKKFAQLHGYEIYTCGRFWWYSKP